MNPESPIPAVQPDSTPGESPAGVRPPPATEVPDDREENAGTWTGGLRRAWTAKLPPDKL
jgi:hypothetical protein